MVVGQIVCSKAGSDKNKFSIIIEIDGNCVFLCDGKRHKLASPKRKNQKHVAVTGEVLNMDDIQTDKALRTALAVYRSNMK